MSDIDYWKHSFPVNFSRPVAWASQRVREAEQELQKLLAAEYPLNSLVYVVHHRGAFEAVVTGWDYLGARVKVRNTITGKSSKWWAAHVELQNRPTNAAPDARKD